MALREFVDSQHVEWRAWDITADRMHPVTAREMFQGRFEDFQEGWVVFESATERRRLAPFPANWHQFPLGDLEELLRLAMPVSKRTSGETKTPSEERGRPAATDSSSSQRVAPNGGPRSTPSEPGAWRTFTGPSGRSWMAAVVDVPGGSSSDPSAGRALRFTSGEGAVCELREFPDDWARFPRERMVDLLRQALPTREAPLDGPFRRRRQDFLP